MMTDSLSSQSWSKEEQEAIYASAFSLYQKGSYAEAAEFFTSLVICDPYGEKYWRGLASSRQMEGKYVDSLRAWSLSSLLAARDPWPHFHAAECLLSLGNKEEAKKALNEARRCRCQQDTDLEGKIVWLSQILS